MELLCRRLVLLRPPSIQQYPKIFLPLTRNAITQAKQLNTKDEDYPTNLGSHIYKLVEKLLKE